MELELAYGTLRAMCGLAGAAMDAIIGEVPPEWEVSYSQSQPLKNGLADRANWLLGNLDRLWNEWGLANGPSKKLL